MTARANQIKALEATAEDLKKKLLGWKPGDTMYEPPWLAQFYHCHVALIEALELLREK